MRPAQILLVLMLSLLFGHEWANASASAESLGDTGGFSVPAEPSEQIPYKRDESTFTQQLLRVGMALIFALAIGVLVIFVVKKLLARQIGTAGGARIRRIEACRLSAKLTAHLVEVDRVPYVVFQSGDQVQIVPHDAKGGSLQAHNKN